MKRLPLLFALAAAAAWIAGACGPFFEQAIFRFHLHPDLPRTEFIDGRLGILQPTFARSYLVIAYRYLNGVGMDSAEREQARDYYKDRTAPWSQHFDPTGVDWHARWLQLRARYPRPPSESPLLQGRESFDPATHEFVLNCAEDAYRTALHTLEVRRDTFGASSAPFRAWLAAQDQVFQNCAGGISIPSAAPSSLPLPIRQDREYQIAAANFYSASYDTALKRFRTISAEAESPWRDISQYLTARTLLRMHRDAETVAEAQRIIADPRLASIHAMTWNLLSRAGLHSLDPEYFNAMARLLSSPKQGDGFREALWNFTEMYDRFWLDRNKSVLQQSDLADWIESYRFPGFRAGVPLAKWRDTGSHAWLLAALSEVRINDPAAAELLAAARLVPADSPAYLTAAYQIARIELQSRDKAGARRLLDELLASPKTAGLPSSRDLLRALRIEAAPDLRDFLKFSFALPAMITTNDDADETVPGQGGYGVLMTPESTESFNDHVPFRIWKQAAQSKALPATLQHELELTAFTRGMLLNAGANSQTTGRQFADAFYLLRHPEARFYLTPGISRHVAAGLLSDFRDNWWCAPRTKNVPSPTPAFLTPADTTEAAAEAGKLASAPMPGDFLGNIVLSWAASHPADPRLPEALYRVVRAAHYSCYAMPHTEAARQSFRLLHRRFPKSEWAIKTPVWF